MLLLLSVIAINCQNVVNQNSTVHHYVPSLTSHSQEEESEYDEDHYPPPPPQVHREHEVIYDEIPHVGSNGFEPPIFGGGATSPNTMSRSRTIETKYGKVKGLSITIAQGRLNPLKNTIVEVSPYFHSDTFSSQMCASELLIIELRIVIEKCQNPFNHVTKSNPIYKLELK